jgi:DNA-binding FadR family transcriptional regulator
MKTKKKSQAKVQFFNELVEAMKNKVHQAIEVEHLNILHRNVLHTKKKFGKKKEYIEKLDHVIKLIEEKLEAIRKNKPNGNQTRLQT